jgi:hypothetical protein
VFVGEFFCKCGENRIQQWVGRGRWVSYCLWKGRWVLLDPIDKGTQSRPIDPFPSTLVAPRRCQLRKAQSTFSGPAVDNEVAPRGIDEPFKHPNRWITQALLDSRNRRSRDTCLGSKSAPRQTSPSSSISKNRSAIHKG